MDHFGTDAEGRSKNRQFGLMETFYAVFDAGFPTCFIQLLVSIRGKLCWSIVSREDVIGKEEAKIYGACIEEVLQEINIE